MVEKRSPGQNKDLENVTSEGQVEGPIEAPDRLEQLYNLIENQNNAILLLTGKMTEMTTGLKVLEEHQDQSDTAIIEVAKKVGGGGGGTKGGDLLAQIIPLLTQQRGPGPLERMAMNSFMRNMAFASLTTERLAKRQFGDEYTAMIKDMEADMYGDKSAGPT